MGNIVCTALWDGNSKPCPWTSGFGELRLDVQSLGCQRKPLVCSEDGACARAVADPVVSTAGWYWA